jgi:hypothetical protein
MVKPVFLGKEVGPRPATHLHKNLVATKAQQGNVGIRDSKTTIAS